MSEILWAPWRISYLKGERPPGCVFCDAPAQDPSRDEQNLILYRGREMFVIMNLFPYANGHLMIVPYHHTDTLDEIKDTAALEMFTLLRHCRHILTKSMWPQGFNVGMNMGRVAGAGIHEHLHLHIVPRWGGDTNFMPVLAETKVISDHLQNTYITLRPHFDELRRELLGDHPSGEDDSKA
ncbi:HIT domain-containing protein [bacterium]|nr:HIT domain-containing protein [bacterium]